MLHEHNKTLYRNQFYKSGNNIPIFNQRSEEDRIEEMNADYT